MEKQKKQFILVLIFLVVLILAYFGIRFYNEKKEEKEEEKEAAETITLTDFETDDVTAFSYELEGATLSFTKDGENWLYDGDNSLELEEDTITSMLYSAASLTAKDALEEYDSLNDYGLDAPENTIVITTSDEMITLLVGNENEITGDYYVMLEGDDTVYLIGTALNNTFGKSVDDLLAEAETEEVTTEEVTEKQAGEAELTTEVTGETEDATEEAEVIEAE